MALSWFGNGVWFYVGLGFGKWVFVQYGFFLIERRWFLDRYGDGLLRIGLSGFSSYAVLDGGPNTGKQRVFILQYTSLHPSLSLSFEPFNLLINGY